jgi:hypothetical protein
MAIMVSILSPVGPRPNSQGRARVRSGCPHLPRRARVRTCSPWVNLGSTRTPDGSLVTPNGETYSRTPERTKRRNGNAYIADGAVVVTEVYPEGMTLFEGEAAQATWQEVLSRLVVGRAPNPVDLQWVGHVWRSDRGGVLLRFEGEH